MDLIEGINYLSITDTENAENACSKADYEGKIIYCCTHQDIEKASKDLLGNFEGLEVVVGFDIEWTVTYEKGPTKVDLIQVSPGLNVCYLFHITSMEKLPDCLVKFLTQSTVILTGVNIKADITRLGKALNIDENLIISMHNNCVDSGTLANEICNEKRRWSMKDLAKRYLKIDLDKNPEVRISKWNKIPLNQEQKKYAAIDSYISLKLYSVLSTELQNKSVLDISLNEEKTDTPDQRSFPILEYSGDINYCKTIKEYEESCRKIIAMAEGSNLVLGFDVKAMKEETTEKVHLIQLSPSTNECFLFKTFGYTTLPEIFITLLTHQNVSLTGFSVKNKISKIKKAFALHDQYKFNIIDLAVMSRKIIGKGECSQTTLLSRVLNCRIPQSPRTKFRWNVDNCSESQLKCAATEAYVALKVHNDLKEKKNSNP